MTEFCRLCLIGLPHRHVGQKTVLTEPPSLKISKQRRKSGEYLRGLGHTALEIGVGQVKAMDAHYAKHGIHVGHRRTRDGLGYEPACLVGRDLERCLQARGLRP
jgi:hypothetical protein